MAEAPADVLSKMIGEGVCSGQGVIPSTEGTNDVVGGESSGQVISCVVKLIRSIGDMGSMIMGVRSGDLPREDSGNFTAYSALSF